MIYLASPYSDPDPAVRQQRFEAACRAAAALLAKGQPVFSPIAHSHPIALHGGLDPLDHHIYMPTDQAVLCMCSEVVVLMLPGWDKSQGLLAEIRAAVRRRMPVAYMEPV